LLDGNKSSPPLIIAIGQFLVSSQGNDRVIFDIADDNSLSDTVMYRWAEEQMLVQAGDDFHSCIEKLLQSYVSNDGLGKAVALAGKELDHVIHKAVQKQKAMMLDMLRMASMWKIWNCEQFFIQRTAGEQTYPIPARLSSVQDRLRSHAKQALSVLERKVLDHLNSYLASNGGIQEKHDPLVWSATNSATWVSLWSLMLIYRQSAARAVQQLVAWHGQPNAAPVTHGGS